MNELLFPCCKCGRYCKRHKLIKMHGELHCLRCKKHIGPVDPYKYRIEMIEAAKSLGNCLSCFGERDNPSFLRCSKCRLRMRIWEKKYYLKRKKEK